MPAMLIAEAVLRDAAGRPRCRCRGGGPDMQWEAEEREIGPETISRRGKRAYAFKTVGARTRTKHDGSG